MPSDVCVLMPSYDFDPSDASRDSSHAASVHLSKYDWLHFGPVRQHRNWIDTPLDYWNRDDPIQGYNACLTTRGFWESISYDWALVYQPDAIIFDDRIDHFIGLGFDYIGAPHQDYISYPLGGNGGFSLRRVEAMREALYDRTAWHTVESYYRWVGINEDLFWSSNDKIQPAPLEVSMTFAWETDPAWWWVGNHFRFPMGAHGFDRHSPEFWQGCGGVRSLAGLPEPQPRRSHARGDQSP